MNSHRDEAADHQAMLNGLMTLNELRASRGLPPPSKTVHRLGMPLRLTKNLGVCFHFPGGASARNYSKRTVLPGEWDVEPTQSTAADDEGNQAVLSYLHFDVWFIDHQHVLWSVARHLRQHFLAQGREFVNQYLDVVRGRLRKVKVDGGVSSISSKRDSHGGSFGGGKA